MLLMRIIDEDCVDVKRVGHTGGRTLTTTNDPTSFAATTGINVGLAKGCADIRGKNRLSSMQGARRGSNLQERGTDCVHHISVHGFRLEPTSIYQSAVTDRIIPLPQPTIPSFDSMPLRSPESAGAAAVSAESARGGQRNFGYNRRQSF